MRLARKQVDRMVNHLVAYCQRHDISVEIEFDDLGGWVRVNVNGGDQYFDVQCGEGPVSSAIENAAKNAAKGRR